MSRSFPRKALVTFLTAGDPSADHTVDYVLAMAEAGADVVELGIPFSDPIAEGPVIQAANQRALAAGTKLADVFSMVERVREKSQVPLVLLTYRNPVYRYGDEAFLDRCKEVGVDGLIFPDLPHEEAGSFRALCDERSIALIGLVAPTSEARLNRLSKDARGFVYTVSSMGVTGARQGHFQGIEMTLQTLRSQTSLPCYVGFGISTPDQVSALSDQADGVIVGSALVKIVEEKGRQAKGPLQETIKALKAALSS